MSTTTQYYGLSVVIDNMSLINNKVGGGQYKASLFRSLDESKLSAVLMST